MKLVFKSCLGISLLMFLGQSLSAKNPIVPKGVYIADPEAHVWNDGKLYIYGSRDESDKYWCSHRHHILSTRDMKTWNMDEDIIVSKGKGDSISYMDKLLFAPDCGYHNGTYYLYFCSPGRPFSEGVATSDSPYGPFSKAKEIKGAHKIDPAIHIDENGQGYYYWGQGKPLGAKLKPNLLELDPTSIVNVLDAPGVKAFHEGASIRKIGNRYYLVFADHSRNKTPSCLGYAISDHPLGPFIYQGIIIDNKGCDPSSWNNHGSIEEFDGQWYVFYHRSTHNSKKMRKACVEPITINEDGTINEVEMSSQGAGPALNPYERIEAESACLLSGHVRIAAIHSTDLPEEGLTQIHAGDSAAFKYINFDLGTRQVEIKTHDVACGGQIEIAIGSPQGKIIARCEVSRLDDPFSYGVKRFDVDNINGTHAVYLNFKGPEGHLFDLDWLSFSPSS